MKYFIVCLSIIIICQSVSHAQWTYDSENPKLVSDATCVQYAVKQIADGNGGTFVFWLDSRSGCNGNTFNDVYGQHYDADGIELWETGGREIISYYSSIQSFEVMRPSSQEGIIIGTHSRDIPVVTDSLRFQKLNDEGVKLWANDLLLATPDGCTGNYFLGFENFSFVFDDMNYIVNFVPTYCGGADGCRITRFSSDGILTGPFNGEPEGNQYYIGSRGIDRTYDGTNDVYLYYTGGNGTGAHAFLMRANAVGDSAWAPIDVLEGTNGLNYKYAAMSDPQGITIAFESTGAQGNIDIFMRRINPNGTWAWGGSILEVCTAEGNQGTFDWVQDEQYIYMVWSDGRPGIIGNAAIYAQKISKETGEVQWQDNGVEVFDQNTYIPYAKCILRDDGKLLVMNESNGEAGFNAQVLNENGETQWPGIVSLSTVGLPFYSDYRMINSSGNIIVAWAKSYSGGGADGIYIAHAQAPLVIIEETVNACNSYTSNGETFTASGTYQQDLPGDSILILNLTISIPDLSLSLAAESMEALANEGNFSWLNCGNNTIMSSGNSIFAPPVSGEYALIVELNGCIDTTDCYTMDIVGVEEWLLTRHITLSPNPSDGILNIRTAISLDNATLRITDMCGRIAVERKGISVNTIQVDGRHLNSGIYYVTIESEGKMGGVKWVRE